MKKTPLILAYLIFTFLIFSCSSDDYDSMEVVRPFEFESLSVSENLSFTDESITLNINRSKFTSIEFIFEDTNMTFNKIDDTTYEINANKASKGNVRVDLTNGDDIESKSVNLEFLEHGVFNSNIVEGIKIDIDKTERLLEVLGEPDGKIEHSSGNTVAWVYNFGVTFIEVKATKIITSAYIGTYSRNVATDVGDILTKSYPYLVNNTFDFSNSERDKMDDIIDELNLPTFTYTGTLPNPLSSIKGGLIAPTSKTRSLYQYVYFYDNNVNHSISVRFFSNNIDDYTGESIVSFSVN